MNVGDSVAMGNSINETEDFGLLCNSMTPEYFRDFLIDLRPLARRENNFLPDVNVPCESALRPQLNVNVPFFQELITPFLDGLLEGR